MTDAVLLLDPASGRRVVDELRRANGGHLTLGVAYPVADGGYVDDAGRPIVLPDPTSGRSLTTIAAGGRAAAVVIHDGRLGTDAALGARCGSGIGPVRHKRASPASCAPRRAAPGLPAAAARRRGRRACRPGAATGGGPLASLALLDGELEAADRPRPSGTEPRAPHDLAPVRVELDAVVKTLTRLAHGLHPPALETDGLAVALHVLAARSAVPVTLSVDGLPAFSNPVASTAWFIASEALTNVTKHAGAGHVDIRAGVQDGSFNPGGGR